MTDLDAAYERLTTALAPPPAHRDLVAARVVVRRRRRRTAQVLASAGVTGVVVGALALGVGGGDGRAESFAPADATSTAVDPTPEPTPDPTPAPAPAEAREVPDSLAEACRDVTGSDGESVAITLEQLRDLLREYDEARVEGNAIEVDREHYTLHVLCDALLAD